MRQEIVHRKLALCDSTADLSVDELTIECPECHEFVLYCCSCSNRGYYDYGHSSKRQRSQPCHHFRIVFTDGACLENGGPNARAGAGVAAGATEGFQLSIPITDEEDPFPVRSNQRAELIAAKEGLKFLGLLAEMNEESAHHRFQQDTPVWIVATDSEYVVRGMTEWVPTWKVCQYYPEQELPGTFSN